MHIADAFVPNQNQPASPRKARLPIAATLLPVVSHAFESFGSMLLIERHEVVVRLLSTAGIALRSRSPMDACAQYRLESSDLGEELNGSRIRMRSCRRGDDGMYEISAEFCGRELPSLAA